MTVLVSDTSVIIDLERGELLESVFQLAVDFAVPDLLFHRELAGPLGDRLLALGLRVEELSPGEVQGATVLRRADATLSLPDLRLRASSGPPVDAVDRGCGSKAHRRSARPRRPWNPLGSGSAGSPGRLQPSGACRWAGEDLRTSALPSSKGGSHSAVESISALGGRRIRGRSSWPNRPPGRR